jgi:serine/threonine protein kinase
VTTASAAPRIIAGRYILDDDFRAGGMARVHRAIDRETHETVAVKILTRQLQPDERYLNLEFEREGRALSRLNHANVVHLRDVGRDEETAEPYFVFDWFDRTLSDVLAASPPAGWDDFGDRHALPILAGLAHAHSQQVLHRDIKPSNVLVGGDGTPKLADFGIAKLKTEFQPGLTLADFQTRPFAPPEFDNGDYSYTRDVFAYGVLCVLSLTQVDPFAEEYGRDPYQALADALDGLDVPTAVEVFLRACVSDDPAERPRNAAVALSTLASIQEERRGLTVEPTVFYLKLSDRARSQICEHFGLALEEAVQALEDDFADDCAVAPFQPREGERADGHFNLLGGEVRLHVAIDQATQDRLFVFNASPLPSSLLEKLRDRAFRQPMRFVVGTPGDRVTARDSLLELQVAVADAENARRAREREEEERRIFRVWRETLQAKTDLEREREAPVKYKRATINGQRAIFELVNGASEELVGQQRQLELRDGGFLGGEIYDVQGTRVFMFIRYGDPSRIPAAGVLRVDTWPARSAILRQTAALDAVTYGRALRSDLGDLISKPERARPPAAVAEAEVEFVQTKLDAAKKEAVLAALGTEDFLAVEGPPGTGKTTFITELVLQHLKRNPGARILVTSQTHAALDNVLERLSHLGSLRLVRVGRSEDPRVSPAVSEFLIENQVEQWSKDVIRGGRAYLQRWAKDAGISARDVEIAMLYEELAALAAAKAAVAEERSALEAELAAVEPSDAGTTAEHAAVEIEERLRELEGATERTQTETDEAAARLIQMKVLGKRDEIDDLSANELRDRALAAVDREHPAYGRCKALIGLLGDWHARFGRGSEFYAAGLVRADVVAATCLGLHAFRGTDTVEFDLCIIDEASKATATETLVPMVQAKRWVLVGDPNQLPPFVEEALVRHDLLREHELAEEDVRQTLFERLLGELPAEATRLLSTQHRMVPAIGDLVSECFYDGALASAPGTRPRWLELAFPKAVTWYTTSRRTDRFESVVGTSRSNQLEAREIRKLLRRINGTAKWENANVTVAVLSGYTAQRETIAREIAGERNEWSNITSLDVASVDAFQGREADILIYSVTRSNREGNIGFLYEPRRLNVALSRGRLGLVLVGDHVCVRHASDPNPFRRVIDHIDAHRDDCVIEELEQ